MLPEPADQRGDPGGAGIALGEDRVLELVASGERQAGDRAGDDDRSSDQRPGDRDRPIWSEP